MDADLRLWLRLLREIEAIGVPTKIGDQTPQFELQAIKEMIEAGWLNGSVLPPVGRILNIYITDITRVARKAVQDNEPSERRKSFVREHYRGIATVVAAIAAVLTLWKSCFQVSPPSPPENTPTRPAQLSPTPSLSPASPVSPPGIP
jgi:hypothetical protein